MLRWISGVVLALLAGAAQAAPMRTHHVEVPWSTAGILSLAVAPDGAVWAAGQLGVFRHDGRETVRYDGRNTPALATAGQIVRIAVDHEGSVWVSTGGGLPLVDGRGVLSTEGGPARGLRRLRAGTWSALGAPEVPDDPYALLAHDRALWVGTRAGVTVLRGGATTRHGRAEGLPEGPITVLVADGPGAALVGGANGLCRLAEGLCTRLFDGPVLAVLRSAPDRLWVGGPRGLSEVAGGAVVQRLLPNEQVRALTRDREGALWAATYRGLVRLHEGQQQTFGTADGLPESRVAALVLDREGGLWTGTRSAGIARVTPAVVTSLGTREGLPGDRVLTVGLTNAGATWALGPEGLVRWTADGALAVWRRGRELPPDEPRTMAVATDGGAWVGTLGAGLVYVSPLGKVQPVRGYGDESVFMVLPDGDDTLWLSGREGDVTRWRVQAGADGPRLVLQSRHPVPQPCAGRVVGGHAGQSGRRYFLTSIRGLLELTDAGLACLPGPLGLRSQPVTSVWEDGQGGVWVGASFDGGLARLPGAGAKPQFFDEKSGLPCDSITGIADDRRGHLWMACAGGVSRVSLSELDAYASGAQPRVTALRFDAATGMRSQESAPGSGPVLAVDGAGSAWIATARGISIIRAPERLAIPAPPVTLDGVWLDGRPATTLSAAAADLEVRYRAIAFTYPGAVRFRHRLLGLEQTWSESAAFAASYRRLPPGAYRFEVQASNAFGLWGDALTTAAVTVRRPWHRSPWLPVAAVAALLGLTFAGHRLRVERMRARFRLLQTERERMARELHDGLGQGFASIGFHLDAVAEHVREAAPQALLEKTRRVLDQCREEARRAVWALRDDVLQGRSLEQALRDFADEGKPPPEVEVLVSGQPRARDGFLEHELYRMATELIGNTRRHAGATRVVVELEWGEDEVVLHVKDDGRGLSGDPAAHAAGGHFGLLGIKERARRLGGDVTMMGAPGVGTEVRVSARLARRK